MINWWSGLHKCDGNPVQPNHKDSERLHLRGQVISHDDDDNDDDDENNYYDDNDADDDDDEKPGRRRGAPI